MKKLLDEGIIEPFKSAWSSPIVPIVKPSGDIRVCGDYQWLNHITAQIHHYMPELGDILGKIGIVKDGLNTGVMVEDSIRDKTTVFCPYGRF